jgi:arylsulfatase A-like enzyme
MSGLDHRLARASYWAMCDLIDVQVGRLLRALDETGQADTTLVIYTSDHGEMLGDHGVYLKGPFLYEPAIRVPLIVWWPGRIASRRSSALVELVDLSQTLLDAANLSHHPGMQGCSLWPLLRGETPADHHRDSVYCEYYNALDSHRDPTAHLTMVRDRQHKLVVDHSGGGGELYDLDADPRERHNLWDHADLLPLKARMLQKLCDRMAWTVDPLPPRHGGW